VPEGLISGRAARVRGPQLKGRYPTASIRAPRDLDRSLPTQQLFRYNAGRFTML